jgi:hypothetical protein
MDTATVRVVLKLQLDEVDAILKTLPMTSDSGVINGERVAFTAFRDELLKKWHNVHGQAFANNIIKEENASREAFKRLLSEEQQAERKWERLCHYTLSVLIQSRRPRHGLQARRQAGTSTPCSPEQAHC